MTYQLDEISRESTYLTHDIVQPLCFRDIADASVPEDNFGSIDDMSELLIRARAQSGDYFDTLATELDKIAQSLALVHAPEAPELERLVRELLVVGRDFTLAKRSQRR